MPENAKTIEVRAFGRLTEIFERKKWAVPLILDMREPITGDVLAAKLEIPREEIEVKL